MTRNDGRRDVQTSIDALFGAGSRCTVHHTSEKGVYEFVINHPIHMAPDNFKMCVSFRFVPGNKRQFRVKLSMAAKEFGNENIPIYNKHTYIISNWVFANPVFSV